MSRVHPDLDLALEVAGIADDIGMRHFRRPGLVVERKADDTPVSEADREAEAAIRDHLAGERPGHNVLGEEFGETGDGDGTWRWIIDPIDGTKNFVRGIPVWANLVALEHAGELVVGVVSAPALGRRWWAARGGGAYADGQRIVVSDVERVEDAHLSGDGYDAFDASERGAAFQRLAAQCTRSRGFGDFWSHMLVAEGAIDIAIEPSVARWDVAAVQVIVEEAGGRFSDLTGAPHTDGGGALSTNGRLHDAVLHAMRA